MNQPWSVQTIPDILRTRVETSATAVALYYQPQGQEWQPLVWEDYWRSTQSLAFALKQLGLDKGDRLGMLAPTSVEWELTHMATMAVGGILVGLEPHDMPERLQRIASHAGLNALVVQDGALLRKLPAEFLRQCKFIITLEKNPEPRRGLTLVTWESLVHAGKDSLALPEALPAPADPATIIYTSGTTGDPKGILYTHQQVALACASIVGTFPHVQEESRFLCWLPLANLFQRIVNLWATACGGTNYLVGDPLRVLEAVRSVEPDVFIGVPRFYEKLYAGIQARIAQQPMWRQKLTRLAITMSGRHATYVRQRRTPPPGLGLLRQLSDALVLRDLRQVMGSRLQFMISGSAPIPVWLLESFHALGLLIVEAYGLSENIVPMAINRVDDFRFGSVGKPVLRESIRLGPEGEVMVRGPGVFAGYYQDTSSRTSFTPDGFYLTGDYATFDDAGFLYLQGRSSEIIKTSGGRRIAPVGIEAKLREIPYIDQAVVIGAGRKCLVGLLTIDWQLLAARTKAAALQRSEVSHEALPPEALSESVRALIVTDIQHHVSRLPRYEQPAGFVVLRGGFSVDGGELTPNMKLRRGAIETKYAPCIETLYDDCDRVGNAASEPPVSHSELVVRYV